MERGIYKGHSPGEKNNNNDNKNNIWSGGHTRLSPGERTPDSPLGKAHRTFLGRAHQTPLGKAATVGPFINKHIQDVKCQQKCFFYLPLSIVSFPTNHSEKSFNVQSTSYGKVGKGLCTQFLSIVTFLKGHTVD